MFGGFSAIATSAFAPACTHGINHKHKHEKLTQKHMRAHVSGLTFFCACVASGDAGFFCGFGTCTAAAFASACTHDSNHKHKHKKLVQTHIRTHVPVLPSAPAWPARTRTFFADSAPLRRRLLRPPARTTATTNANAKKLVLTHIRTHVSVLPSARLDAAGTPASSAPLRRRLLLAPATKQQPQHSNNVNKPQRSNSANKN